MTAKLFDSSPRKSAPTVQSIGLAPPSRILRDFLLLITVCLSVGLSVGVGMMAAVLVLF